MYLLRSRAPEGLARVSVVPSGQGALLSISGAF
jgi:hypothetical protein